MNQNFSLKKILSNIYLIISQRVFVIDKIIEQEELIITVSFNKYDETA